MQVNLSCKIYNKLLPALLLMSNVVFAQDLLETYIAASESDPTIRAAREQYNASKQAIPRAISSFLPQISGSLDTAANESSNPIFKKNNTWSMNLDISQPIYRMRDWAQYAQAKEEVKSAIAVLNDAEQQLFLRVATQYFSILKAHDNLAFARSEKRAFSRQLEQTQQRFKVGLIAVTDVHESMAKRDNAIAREINAENSLENEREILREITGFPDRGIQDLKNDIVLQEPNPKSMDKWVETALERNWTLHALRSNLEVARHKIRVDSSAHMPELSFISKITRDKLAPPTAAKATNKNATLRLNIPIFSGGNTTAITREAQHLYEKTAVELEQSYREIESETRQAYRNVAAKISQAAAFKQTVKSSKSALKAIQGAYDVGTRTVVDVLDAESGVFAAERDYSQSRYDYVVEWLTLKQKAGTLSLDDIELINSWLKSKSK